jgi:hypothetical protein
VSQDIEVGEPRREDGAFRSTVRVDGRSYDVTVTERDMQSLAPGSTPRELIAESFRFLLEREPASSILPSFDLRVIGRYFPEYTAEIAARLAR